MIEGVRMEYSKRFSGNDELRMRFTVWLKIVVKRVKIDYIRRQKKRYIEVSIEEAAITNTLTYEQQFDINENSNKFIFENSRISAAFNKLSSKRKEILEMLFVRNLTSDEIAKEWKCSLQYVYLLRSSALTKLRDILTRGNNWMEYNFRCLLESAIEGCQHSIERLLLLYRPLIDGNSYLHGKLDEDLRQYIIVHIIKKLPKFRI